MDQSAEVTTNSEEAVEESVEAEAAVEENSEQTAEQTGEAVQQVEQPAAGTEALPTEEALPTDASEDNQNQNNAVNDATPEERDGSAGATLGTTEVTGETTEADQATEATEAGGTPETTVPEGQDGQQDATPDTEEKPEAELAEGEGEGTTEEGETTAGNGETSEDQEQTAEEGVEGTPTDGEGEGETLPEGQTRPESQTEAPAPEELPLQSDTFDEGELEESPVAVGERLSREGSPTGGLDMEDLQPEMLEPATPDQVSEAGEEETPQELMEMEEDQPEPEIDRAQLIERYHAAIAERDQLQQQNYQLQHKIAEYFRKKKSDETRQDFDKNVSDQEQRYIKYMANLEELRKQEGLERENYSALIDELRERCMEKQERVEGERVRFSDFKKQVAVNSLNSRSGKTIPPKDIEQYLTMENRKDNDVVNVRLENIKLKNKLKKKEQQLKSKEELAEGLHLIDFEQLKIENQTYNEKIEERNEELLKLRKKITSTVQVLTHLKEKLQFVQAENQVQNTRLRDVESVAAQKRDILSRTKQARDALRIDNQKLRQNCGLLGNESLLRNFEEQRDESDDLKMKLERLRMQHAELTLNCNQVRRKIEQARLNQM